MPKYAAHHSWVALDNPEPLGTSVVVSTLQTLLSWERLGVEHIMAWGQHCQVWSKCNGAPWRVLGPLQYIYTVPDIRAAGIQLMQNVINASIARGMSGSNTGQIGNMRTSHPSHCGSAKKSQYRRATSTAGQRGTAALVMASAHQCPMSSSLAATGMQYEETGERHRGCRQGISVSLWLRCVLGTCDPSHGHDMCTLPRTVFPPASAGYGLPCCALVSRARTPEMDPIPRNVRLQTNIGPVCKNGGSWICPPASPRLIETGARIQKWEDHFADTSGWTPDTRDTAMQTSVGGGVGTGCIAWNMQSQPWEACGSGAPLFEMILCAWTTVCLCHCVTRSRSAHPLTMKGASAKAFLHSPTHAGAPPVLWKARLNGNTTRISHASL